MATTTDLRVLGDRVLIKPDTEERIPEQTASGLYTAPTLAAAVDGTDKTLWYTTGTIVQIGHWPPDAQAVALAHLRTIEAECGQFVSVKEIIALRRKLESLPTQRVRDYGVGDRVTFSVQAGHDVTIDGEPFVVMRDKDLIGVLEEQEIA